MDFLAEIKKQLSEIADTSSSNPISINFFHSEINWLFQKCILSGEHYKEDASQKILEIEGVFNDLDLKAVKIESTKVLQEFKGIEIKAFKNAIQIARGRFYRPFYELIGNIKKNLAHYLEGKEREVFDISQFQDFRWKKELKEILQFSSTIQSSVIIDDAIYRINIFLAYLDEYLECKGEVIETLKNIDYFLTSEISTSSYQEILQILIYKSNFFLFKIKYRDYHPQEDILDTENDFDELEDNNCYKIFYDKALSHYKPLSSKDVRELENQFKRVSNIAIEQFKIEPLHHLKRHFYKTRDKDLYRAKSKIDDFLSKVKEKLNSSVDGGVKTNLDSLSVYNKISFKSIETLLNNTSLSLELRIMKKNDYAQIKADIKKYIKSEQSETEVDFLKTYLQKLKNHCNDKNNLQDYYCYIIFLRFLIDMINSFKSKPNSVIGPDDNNEIKIEEKRRKILEMIKYVRNIYKETLKELNDNVLKALSHKAFPVYLSYEECFINYDGEDKSIDKLFLRSSYILPNNFVKVKNQIESWNILMYAQYNALIDTFEVAISQIEAKYKINDFQKKIKENEFKLVQIVAMFVSIATFVLINVKIFDNKTGKESFALILGLAACFLLFNLFFYIIIIAQYKENEKGSNLGFKITLFSLLLIGFAWTSYSLLDSENIKIKDIDQFNQKLDSNNSELKAKLKKDSITIQHILEKIKG